MVTWWTIRFPLLEAPGILPSTGDPAPDRPAPRARRIQCEFCECELGPDGSFLKLSDRAKQLRSHDDTVEAKDKIIARLEEEKATLQRENNELKGTKRRGLSLTM